MSSFTTVTVLLLLILSVVYSQDSSSSDGFPCPFYRELVVKNPPLNGNDIIILQQLLSRSFENVALSGNFDQTTSYLLSKFQSLNQIDDSGNLDIETANILLENNLADGYKDNGMIPPGFLYKVYVPVFKNRSIETTAFLYDNQMNVLLNFTVRTHGQMDNSTGLAMNEFCGDGSTPTGLMLFDFNSPEPDPVSFGPYPINRAVQGLTGNAYTIISNIRDGILLHTGEWPNWNPSMPMPNSHGCIHSHPDDIYQISQILPTLGVQMRQNTYGQLPYPYQPQGILSIELIE
ncbi:hypothetical protein DLAC_03176 [Tieghemostelium lacteum]|uniref:Uncharacterized protein n=1 Tax=Tieghemostelium lacteum TaxID=361077 RepID=A0A152A2Z6_TIELA|nr:hypothetical protein DLAC_03176 [Tieghemostelium lacteum]|eukprot:KYR00421.1 hypothetical protein DLAC_03176 [Tieghemostelium lacteum]